MQHKIYIVFPGSKAYNILGEEIIMSVKTNENKLMTDGSIARQIFFFSVPLILGNLLQQLYNTADSIIVGNYVGSNALAAVGSSTSLICLLIAFSQGASVGAGAVSYTHLTLPTTERV